MRTLRSLAFIFVLVLPALALAELNCAVHLADTQKLLAHHPVRSTLKETLTHHLTKRPVTFVDLHGHKLPKYSKTSKWRAVVVLPEEDLISHQGYRSGLERFGDDVPTNRRAKFNDAVGEVSYELADGRTLSVSATEARALEFSYLDAKNIKNAQNSIVVGIHDDPEKLITLVHQSGAEKLLNEMAYIRLDEVEVENLPLTSAEELYRKYHLRHRNYDPNGEWVVDQSIPAENLVGTYKFKAITQVEAVDLEVDELVTYEAINGVMYEGRVESTLARDGYVTVYYLDQFGRKQRDIAHVSKLKRSR